MEKKENMAYTQEIDKLHFTFMREEKKAFLKGVSKSAEGRTTKTYISILSSIIEEAEYKNNKNWYEFSPKMVDDAFFLLSARTANTLLTYKSIISDYLTSTTPEDGRYYIGHTYTISLSREELKKYINPIAEQSRYITEKEFEDIIFNQQGDAMAKSIFILLWFGVKGESFKDIYGLKVDQVKEDGYIMKDDELLAIIPLKYMKIINQALASTSFVEFNRDGEVILTSYLAENTGYFLRRSIYRNKDHMMPPDRTLLSRRVKSLCAGLKNEYIDAQSIFASGHINRLIEMCGGEMPTNKDLEKYRQEIGTKISYTMVMNAAKIIVQKLEKEKLTSEE